MQLSLSRWCGYVGDLCTQMINLVVLIPMRGTNRNLVCRHCLCGNWVVVVRVRGALEDAAGETWVDMMRCIQPRQHSRFDVTRSRVIFSVFSFWGQNCCARRYPPAFHAHGNLLTNTWVRYLSTKSDQPIYYSFHMRFWDSYTFIRPMKSEWDSYRRVNPSVHPQCVSYKVSL